MAAGQREQQAAQRGHRTSVVSFICSPFCLDANTKMCRIRKHVDHVPCACASDGGHKPAGAVRAYAGSLSALQSLMFRCVTVSPP